MKQLKVGRFNMILIEKLPNFSDYALMILVNMTILQAKKCCLPGIKEQAKFTCSPKVKSIEEHGKKL